MKSLDYYLGRFMTKTVVTEDNHWLWQGAKQPKTKHGLVTITDPIKQLRYLHRFIYCLKFNKDYNDTSFILCHKRECNIPSCWNPDHLYEGTYKDNLEDRRFHQTTCPHGHILAGNNWKDKHGTRHCKTCRRLKSAIRKRKNA